MARKSGWQQFADNFKSVYGAYKDWAMDEEYQDIMDAKVEETGFSPDDMGDPEPTQWSYLGETFDAKPTREQMRGLQYKAIGDSRMRYGDVEGALDMQLRREEIDQRAMDNKLNRDLYKELLFQKGKGASDQMRAGIDNTKSQTGLNNANRDRIVDLTPVEIDLKGSQIGLNQANQSLTEAKADSQLIDNRFDEATFDTRVDATTAATQQAQAGAMKAGVGAKTAQQEYDIKAPMNNMLIDFGKRAENGEFDNDPAAGSKALLEIYQQFDPKGAAELAKTFDDEEIRKIGMDGTRVAAEVKAALADGTNWRQNVIDFIDKENGIDFGADIVEDADGFHLASMRDGKVFDYVISAPSLEELRTKIATDYTDPAGSLGLAVEMAKLEKTKAETNELNTEAVKNLADAQTPPRNYNAELLQRGLQNYLADSDAYQVAALKGDKEAMVRIENDYRKSVGLAPRAGSQVPEGISPMVWDAMTDEEKQLFTK
jgi:hypothetical protein